MSSNSKKTSLIASTFLGAWAALTSAAQAQYPARFGAFGAPVGPPAVSPYLNLLNTGDAAINYYGLVRPQFGYNRAIQALGNEVNYLESNPAGGLAAQQPVFQTGNRAGFMTQYRYFMTNGSAGGPRGGARPGSAGGGAMYGAPQAPQAPVAPRGY